MKQHRLTISTFFGLFILGVTLAACGNNGHAVIPKASGVTQPQDCNVSPLSNPNDRRTEFCMYSAPSPTPIPMVNMNIWYALPTTFNFYPQGYPNGSILARIPRNQSCAGSLPVNTSVNGSSDHNSQISNVFEVFVNANGMSELIGWEYQTYGGAEEFQLAGSLSISASGGLGFVSASYGYSYNTPIVPFNGSVWSAVQTIVSNMGYAGKALPFPLNQLNSGNTTVRKTDCYGGTG